MIGNLIVTLAVCLAALYLHRQWKKTRDSDCPSCAGCDACAGGKKHDNNTILDSMKNKNNKEK